jgi:hypothetical protein
MSRRFGAALRGVALLALLAACAAPAPQPAGAVADRLLVHASDAGRRAYDQGNYAQARAAYQRALARAQAIDAAAAAADAAYNLALSEIGLQDYAAAGLLLRQAEYDAARAGAQLADIRLMRAKVAYLGERLPEAAVLANAVAASDAAPGLRLQAMLLRGQLRAEAGDPVAAAAELRSVRTLAAGAGDALTPSIRADMEKLQGRIALLENKADAAARAFDDEASLLQAAQRFRDMAYALARAAGAGRRPLLSRRAQPRRPGRCRIGARFRRSQRVRRRRCRG